MEISMRELGERIAIIKHKEKGIKQNVFDIGKELIWIRDNSAWKGTYDTFRALIDANFTFSLRQGERFMAVTAKFGKHSDFKSLGITKLYLLTQVPDEHFDEVLEKVEKEKLTTTDIIKEVKRFQHQAGGQPRYSNDPDEHKLKLLREWPSIKEMRENIQVSLDKWIEQANKFSQDPEISKCLTEARNL